MMPLIKSTSMFKTKMQVGVLVGLDPPSIKMCKETLRKAMSWKKLAIKHQLGLCLVQTR